MFSGAVRAVFRKKKGFGFVKILHWLLLVLFSAAAALARLRLLAVGFDADGLPVPMDLNTMALPAVLVVAAVIALIMARRYPAQRELCGSMDLYFAFDRSTLAVMLMVLGSFALIGSAVCSLVFSLRTTLTMILSVFLAVGAACLLYATTALRRKAEFPGVALLVPVCAMVLALILFYREHAADPDPAPLLCRNAGARGADSAAARICGLCFPRRRAAAADAREHDERHPLRGGLGRAPDACRDPLLRRRRVHRARYRRGGGLRSVTPSYIRI